MSKSNLIIKDSFKQRDSFDYNGSNGLWARTEVIGGYGDVIHEEGKKTTLGEVIFRTKNIVPLGGVSYAMEKIFGVPETQIDIPTIYDKDGIGKPNSTEPTETYIVPPGTEGHVKHPVYRYGHFVQLFGVGITGSAENDINVYHPDYRENDITLNKTNTDGISIYGQFVPFRYTMETLDELERKQYFGKKKGEDEVSVGYYLKRFEQDPVIKHIWKTGEEVDIDDEELISNADVWKNSSGLNTVETFTEIYLQINKKDVKEWFEHLEQEDRTRINTIALFTGEYVPGTIEGDWGDYRDVRLFSKLCIKPEYLDRNKNLNIIYRVYGC